MNYVFVASITLALSVFGMACLAIAQPSHWTALTCRPALSLRSSRLIRGIGAGAMAASLAVELAIDGGGFGTLFWVFSLGLAGGAVATILAMMRTCSRLVVPLTPRGDN